MTLKTRDVNILFAEDDEINREVVLSILEPLEINIDTASNGEEAVEMLLAGEKGYDLIFMDYLMPVMNGVQATEKVRSTGNTVPIIALTASDNELDRLLDAGMNDYILKPLSIEDAIDKLVRWLPEEKVLSVDKELAGIEKEDSDIPAIEGIDIEAGIRNTSSLRLFKKLLSDYAHVIEWKAAQIEKEYQLHDLNSVRIDVHTLKSSSNLVGAIDISKEFASLEGMIIGGEDYAAIGKKLAEVMKDYRAMSTKLDSFCNRENAGSVEVPVNRIISILEDVVKDADRFFLDGVDSSIAELEKYKMPDTVAEDFNELKMNASDVAMGHVVIVAERMINVLKKEV